MYHDDGTGAIASSFPFADVNIGLEALNGLFKLYESLNAESEFPRVMKKFEFHFGLYILKSTC